MPEEKTVLDQEKIIITADEIFTDVKGMAAEVKAEITKLLDKGNATRIIIENKAGKQVANLSATTSIIGLALAPVILLAAGAALATGQISIIVEREIKEGEEAETCCEEEEKDPSLN